MSTPTHRSTSGSSYFVNTKCWQNRSAFQVVEIADILLNTLFDYCDAKAYLLDEFVIMPDQLHLILTPSSTTSLEKAIQLIKGGSSHQIHKVRTQHMQIWQEGIYDSDDSRRNHWRTRMQYIHMNPVHARLAQLPKDWPYSSASGKFLLDAVPDRWQKLASEAKA